MVRPYHALLGHTAAAGKLWVCRPAPLHHHLHVQPTFLSSLSIQFHLSGRDFLGKSSKIDWPYQVRSVHAKDKRNLTSQTVLFKLRNLEYFFLKALKTFLSKNIKIAGTFYYDYGWFFSFLNIFFVFKCTIVRLYSFFLFCF